jgi:hypothetical protein
MPCTGAPARPHCSVAKLRSERPLQAAYCELCESINHLSRCESCMPLSAACMQSQKVNNNQTSDFW